MKFLVVLTLLTSTAFAGECCTGSCWTTGCCDPRQRCTNPPVEEKKYQCVNVKDSSDVMNVRTINGEIQKKLQAR